jgi:hypothetical protein
MSSGVHRTAGDEVAEQRQLDVGLLSQIQPLEGRVSGVAGARLLNRQTG